MNNGIVWKHKSASSTATRNGVEVARVSYDGVSSCKNENKYRAVFLLPPGGKMRLKTKSQAIQAAENMWLSWLSKMDLQVKMDE